VNRRRERRAKSRGQPPTQSYVVPRRSPVFAFGYAVAGRAESRAQRAWRMAGSAKIRW